MTDNEIIKALECCGDEEELHWCTECPYYDKENDFCQEDLHRDALSLINRQKSEIDYWKRNVYDGCTERGRIEKSAKAEAIKEFAERLKEDCPDKLLVIHFDAIDNLVKEMVGGDNAQ